MSHAAHDIPRYRLADSTVVEPLVHRWAAWPYVLPPLAAGLHLLNYQLPLLRSYLADPAQHVAAAHDPALIGGPFMDVPPARASEVRAFLEETEAKRAELLGFTRAAKDFQAFLVAEARGQSLEPYYARIPEPLRGYVELVYDYHDRPSLRFLENLLYESPYYQHGLQSLRLSRLERDGQLPFFMTTPRLDSPGEVDWKLPFADPRVDALFRLDVEPRPLEEVRALLGLSPAEDARLLPLLSPTPARTAEPWREKRVRVRYFGHACVLLEYDGISILTDPYVAAVPHAGGLERHSWKDLPAHIDYALVTHAHQDHFALETLLRLRHRLGTLVVPRSHGMVPGDVSLRMLARKLGFPRVVELAELDSIPLPDGHIAGVPFFGEHGDLVHGKSGYAVRLGREQVLIGADSDCLDARTYEHVCRALGPFDTVFLGTESVGAPLTWSVGPLFPKPPAPQQAQSRRYHGSNARNALRLLEAVGARRIYTYAMGAEPWVEHLLGLGMKEDSPQMLESNAVLAQGKQRGLVADRPIGKVEFCLEPLDTPRPTVPAPEPAPRAPESDTEDQFAF
jgi:L-ascorbate metabolism protein UlaG (beta-lactamase superfamily)